MKIGYARVSTGLQNLDLQEDSLKFFGCEKIFTEVDKKTPIKVIADKWNVSRTTIYRYLDKMKEEVKNGEKQI